MCDGASCVRRGAELYMVIIIFYFTLWITEQNSLATDLSVPPPRKLNEKQSRTKCLRAIAWWIHLIFLLGINSTIRFLHKDLMAMRLATISYAIFLFTGLLLWWTLKEFGYDHHGLAATLFRVIWSCCATLGIAHLINLSRWTIKLEKDRRELNAHHDKLSSIQNANDTDTKIDV